MNDLLIKLLEVSKKIKHGGELQIPQCISEFHFELKIVWYKDKKHQIDRSFNIEQLQSSRIDILEDFIANANDQIEYILNPSTQR